MNMEHTYQNFDNKDRGTCVSNDSVLSNATKALVNVNSWQKHSIINSLRNSVISISYRTYLLIIRKTNKQKYILKNLRAMPTGSLLDHIKGELKVSIHFCENQYSEWRDSKTQ